MGTKVQIDSYMSRHFSMRDLSRESNGASWPPYYQHNNIPNNGHGQYYGFLPTTTSDSHSDYDKDVVKQTMLEHEVIFKNQVFELHRLYQVQRDLMDEVRRKEEIKHRIPYETSSSSSHVPSHMQYNDDMHQRWNTPAFPFANRSIPSNIQSSPLSIKGKSIQIPFQNCCSPKNSEVSESRPTKCRRKMFDLQLPGDEYIDLDDEVEQFGEAKVSDNIITPSPDKYRFVCENGKPFLNYTSRSRALADLNEPLNVEETTVDSSSVDFSGAAPRHSDVRYRDCSNKLFGSSKEVPQRSVHRSNTPFENGSNGRDWFCYPSESEHKGNVRPINNNKGTPSTSCQPIRSLLHQLTQPPPSLTCDRTKGDVSSHVPNRTSLFHPSDLAKTRDPCSSSLNKPSGFFSSSHKSPVITTSPTFLDSKSPQSSAQSNYVFGNKWNLNSTPGANATYGGESSAKNGFYPGSGFKDIPGRVGPLNLDDVKPATGVNSSTVKGVNLNVPYSNGISYDQTVQPNVKVVDNKHKSKDPLSVLPPWLRGNGSCSKEAENSKNGMISCVGDVKSEKPKSSDFPSSRKILGVPIFEKAPTPKKEEIDDSSWRKGGFDMNLPCELSDSEVDTVNVEVEKSRQNESDNNVRKYFDLNMCVSEEESPCGTTASLKGDTGIDLEAPVMVESDDDVLPEKIYLTTEPEEMHPELVTDHTDNGESELAKSAAEMIVAISSSFDQSQPFTEATCPSSGEEKMLQWFVDIACTSGTDPESHMIPPDPTVNNGDQAHDRLPQGLDDYESMILRSKECTVEEYFPKPSIPEFPNMEDNRPCMLTTRTRKGHARRGRQRRDFQRDILPGLTSLSRHEVTQDLQTFGGLMRATGHTWHSAPNRRNATRNGCGRGRRRSVVVPPAPAHTAISPSKQVSSSNTEVVLEDRCLTGWGKTTRRPRRQRCPSGNPPPSLASQLQS